MLPRTMDTIMTNVSSQSTEVCTLSILYIIIIRDPVDVRTNRGNYLLLKLLKHRYPKLLNTEAEAKVTRWLSFTEGRKGEKLLSQTDVVYYPCYR